MNRPILFVAYIALASAIGFIAGTIFDDEYRQEKIVLKTISQHDEVRRLFDTYGLIIFSTHVLNDLSSVKGADGIDELKAKYQNNAISHVAAFRRQIADMRKGGANQSTLNAFEENVSQIEAKHSLRAP